LIVKCKICGGTGRFIQGIFNQFLAQGEVCPACKGAGEFELNFSGKLIECKFCNGNGIDLLSSPLKLQIGTLKICPACKGVGVLERPIIGPKQNGISEVSNRQTPRLLRHDYDVAVSYANEDRKIVQKYCYYLSSNHLDVFYDKYEEVGFWGANLYDKLDEVYRLRASFCVIFISHHYATKVWTNHERKSAQARALQENREYVLPVKLDDTDIPGIPPTIGYVDFRQISIEKLVKMTIEKVKYLKISSS